MKSILSLLAIVTITQASAQDFPGYRAGNYTGVNGVFFNPANIADSRYRFDINLFSISTSVGNNQASFNLRSVTQSFDSDSLKSQIFGNNAGPSSGMINLDVRGPSVMFNAGKKAAFAITTRARTMANIIDLDGKLAKQLTDDFNPDIQLPYTISSPQNMRMAVNSWAEFGASYAQVLSDKGAHFFKGGLTLKYLAGAANGYFNIDNFRSTINEELLAQDAYLSNTTGRIAAGFGGVDIGNFELDNSLNMEGSGFGGDIGVVYEYRPDYTSSQSGRNRNKYKIKAGLALVDLGKIRYKADPARSGAYDIEITGSERLYLKQLADTEVDDFDSFFRSKPQFFSPAGGNDGDYKVGLPSTLQLDVDYHLQGGFYASLAAQLPIQGKAVYNSSYYSSFSLTPRYEGRVVGVYLPLNYNSLTDFNAGVSLRAGPFFIGSGSILSAALGNSKQADVHVGLRFGGLQKDAKKAEEKEARKEQKRKNRAAERDN